LRGAGRFAGAFAAARFGGADFFFGGADFFAAAFAPFRLAPAFPVAARLLTFLAISISRLAPRRFL
jgi:hypothetical protein